MRKLQGLSICAGLFHIPQLRALLWFPHWLPCPSTSLLVFQNPVLLFPSASPYPCGGDCMCLLLLNCCSAMGLSQRTASGWATWSMQHMLKWNFRSISGCCWGCVAQQGYLRTQILLYITELSILCAEVGLGCCINRLFHIKHHSLPFSKMKLLSLWPLHFCSGDGFVGVFCPLTFTNLCDDVTLK